MACMTMPCGRRSTWLIAEQPLLESVVPVATDDTTIQGCENHTGVNPGTQEQSSVCFSNPRAAHHSSS